MVVAVSVGDVRAHPQTIAHANVHDADEETQVLYGERVRLVRSVDGWASIEAIEQPEFTHANRWQGYPGWLPTSALVPWDHSLEPTIVVTDKWGVAGADPYTLSPSRWRFAMGTRLRATDIDEQLWRIALWNGTTVWMRHESARALETLRRLSPSERRRLIVRQASLFLGDAYYWGGRSPMMTPHSASATGVDCSGLVNLAYRAAGIDIPRDAHEQFLRARPITTLRPADLIFLSERGQPSRIVHVMLYAGGGDVIEGPGTGRTVRRIAIAQRLGAPVEALAAGAVVDGQTVTFGAYLP